MRLWRADNPEVAMNLIPWFVPTNQNPIQMGWELHERLKEKPEDTFCLVALKGRIVQAVLIAYKRKRDVWLWQAHARKGFKYSRTIFDGLKYWSKSVGKNRIRMGAVKRFKAYQRRWGFTPCRWDKKIMEIKL